jgi:hypothetical protein
MKFVPQAGSKQDFVTQAATVTVLPDSKVKICYLDKFDTTKTPPELKSKVTFSDGSQCKIFEFTELPMQFSTEDEGVEAILRVKSEGSKVLEFLPWNESGLKGKFIQFSRTNGEGTDPIPFEKKKFQEDNPDVLQFGATFKIEGGMFDGMLVHQYLQFSQSGLAKKSKNPYSFSTFTKDEDGNVALGFQPLPNGTTGYKWSDQIYDLRHCGLLEGAAIPMPEDGNPLKAIEQKLLMANKLVEIEVVKGYVASLSSAKKLGTFGARAVVEPVQEVVTPATSPDEM